MNCTYLVLLAYLESHWNLLAYLESTWNLLAYLELFGSTLLAYLEFFHKHS